MDRLYMPGRNAFLQDWLNDNIHGYFSRAHSQDMEHFVNRKIDTVTSFRLSKHRRFNFKRKKTEIYTCGSSTGAGSFTP